ncbi:methyl-accepting chemotaxis protein [Caldicellulosiruptor danielii]|uniref:Methyl-accepting chemotaxis protein n=1 Tax=Anaerocellum danielii TaxID=1387557 RepID=A0ABZ0U6S7_9FIRM|nr:methyl-accepting chemotaxis protein [Caldicellulosiruptor danielii]WPX09455.1 methyl-accepting chemotaxis protein [Caldicellulosiruptor danielii]
MSVYAKGYYSKVLSKEEFAKYMAKTKISISTKLTVGVLSLTLWIGPLLLKYITLKVYIDNITKMKLVLISISINVIIAFVLWVINKSILSPVPVLSRLFSRVSEGYLITEDIKYSNDEFGIITYKLIETVKSIKKLIISVKNAVDNSIEIFEVAQKLFSRLEKDSSENAKIIEKQQSDIQRVAASVEEINA